MTTVKQLIKDLTAMYDPNDELVVAYWDADWLKARADIKTAAELEIAFDACSDAVEMGNLGDMITTEIDFQLAKHRANEIVKNLVKHAQSD